MPINLARAIGEPQRAPELRKATVTAMAADGTVTLRFGTGGTPIAGVRRLSSAGVIVNDRVWALQQGYDLLVIGKVDPGIVYIGTSPFYGSFFAQFSHAAMVGAGQYALMQQSNGATYLNAASGTNICLRINNTDICIFQDADIAGYRILKVFRGTDNFAWTGMNFLTQGHSRQGVALHVDNNGIAPMINAIYGEGEQIHAVHNNGTIHCAFKGTAFNLSSSLDTKRNVRAIDPGARAKVKQMRPVRFNRPAGTCANCAGDGCDICNRYGPPGYINSPAIDRNLDQMSLIAEELVEVAPEVVNWSPSDPEDDLSEPKPTGIDLGGLVAMAIAAIQELDARLDALEGK